MPAEQNAIIMPKVIKFVLPTFDAKDVKTWFQAADLILKANNIQTEDDKFAALLQYLDSSVMTHISDVMTHENMDNRFTAAKEKLIKVYGKSRDEEIQMLLKGAKIEEKKPSLILSKLSAIAGPKFDQSLLRSIWFEKLPIRTREILTINTDMELDKQADLADRLMATYETAEASVSYIAPVIPPNTTVPLPTNSTPPTPGWDVVISMLAELRADINAVRNETREHSRRSNRDNSQRYRNRSQTPFRRNRSQSRGRPQMFDDICWYHNKFGNNARNCDPACRHYSKENQKN